MLYSYDGVGSKASSSVVRAIYCCSASLVVSFLVDGFSGHRLLHLDDGSFGCCHEEVVVALLECCCSRFCGRSSPVSAVNPGVDPGLVWNLEAGFLEPVVIEAPSQVPHRHVSFILAGNPLFHLFIEEFPSALALLPAWELFPFLV